MAKEEKKKSQEFERVTVTPSQLADLLKVCIPARQRVLISGSPGIGKTDIVRQVSEYLERDLVISHPAVSDPTDAKGFPLPNQDRDRVRFVPLGEVYAVVNAKRPTVWFIDDLGQAPAAVQAGYMQWLHGGKLNEHSVPECVSIIAATNRKQDRAGVTGLLEPVKSRFHTHVELLPTIEDFVGYASKRDFVPEILGFLNLRPDMLNDFRPSADLISSPSPRAWSHVNDLLKAGVPRSVELQVLSGTIGPGEALEFTGWLQIYRDIPPLEPVWKNPETAPIPGLGTEKQMVLHAYVTALSYHVNAQRLPAFISYIHRLHKEKKSEIAIYGLRDAIRRKGKDFTAPIQQSILKGDLARLIESIPMD